MATLSQLETLPPGAPAINPASHAGIGAGSTLRTIALGLLPSMSDFAFLLPLAILFLWLQGTGNLLADGDPGWHLRAGEWILANGTAPHMDLFSFSKAGQPWFAWEWLWEAAFAKLHMAGGMAAVLLASVAVLSITTCLMFRLALRLSANGVVAIVLTVLACGASSVHFIARPHLFTLLFTIIFFSILENARANKRISVIWLLPVLTIVWANVHGGFITGVFLIAVYGVGAIVRELSLGESWRDAWPAGRGLLVTALLCLAASLLNPYSYRLHLHVLDFLNDPFAFLNIVEFQPLNFHSPIARFFEPLLALGFVTAVWSALRRRFEHAILLGVWTHLALMSARNIPIFAILLTPIAALCIVEWLTAAAQSKPVTLLSRAADQLKRFGAESAEMERTPRFYLCSAAGMALLAAVLYAPNPPEKFRPAYNPDRFPVKAISAVPTGSSRVFTGDAWAGYLIYQQYPVRKVFVDGRSDFYGDAVEKAYGDILNARPGWQQLLQQYRIDTILLPPDTTLVSTLRLSPAWQPVYEDKTAVVFRAVKGMTTGSVSRSVSGGARETASREPAAIEAPPANTLYQTNSKGA